MVVAEAFVPVYVWPAVRYTGEVLAFPTRRRVEAL
jgi:hypothetical protein